MHNLLFFVTLLFFTPSLIFGQAPTTTANDVIPTWNDHFRYGVNPGYYPTWNDDKFLANIAAGNTSLGIEGAGVTAFRASLPEHFVNQWGYNVRVSAFQHYEMVGMDNHTVFLQEPESAHQDMTAHCAGQQSLMFANLYEDIWDGGANGTPVNDDNYYAVYVYNVVETYKDYVDYWEIMNEPDLSYSSNAWQLPGVPGNWWENDPAPCDIAIKAPIQYYIRTMRIAYEVIKSLDANATITTGGLGYPSFLHAILRNTDNPVDGSVNTDYPHTGGAYFDVMSYHVYPHLSCYRVWNNTLGQFEYIRHSDAAADCIVDFKNNMEAVLLDFGYDGITYPEKRWIITESNVPRKGLNTSPENYGTEELQRNWLIKAMVAAQLNDIEQVHLFRLGERQDLATATWEFDLMGLYKNLLTASPYNQEYTDEGIAMRTMSETLSGMFVDQAKTNAMNLPSNIKGAAFVDAAGNYTYVLWAVTQTDMSEVANATYGFPASFNITSLQKTNWSASVDGISSTINSQNINLTGEPIFLVADTSCPPTLSISNTIPNGIHQADINISSDGTVFTGTTVEFKAGTTICLESGFEIQLGANFIGEIEPCGN